MSRVNGGVSSYYRLINASLVFVFLLPSISGGGGGGGEGGEEQVRFDSFTAPSYWWVDRIKTLTQSLCQSLEDLEVCALIVVVDERFYSKCLFAVFVFATLFFDYCKFSSSQFSSFLYGIIRSYISIFFLKKKIMELLCLSCWFVQLIDFVVFCTSWHMNVGGWEIDFIRSSVSLWHLPI